MNNASSLMNTMSQSTRIDNVLVNDKGSARQLGKHSQRSCYQLLREGIIQVDSSLESDCSQQKSISSSLGVHAKDLKQEKSYKVFNHLEDSSSSDLSGIFSKKALLWREKCKRGQMMSSHRILIEMGEKL
ncbi:unnamed protein product [Moneuplotes crassus]|uniref:Uncharacterized protein n=1 Tax=Euplotes crassus TaxID=5936 RepID=A0AAD1UG23_EUPCR|nr:unnamed protein product [Moneuplotes crassus]